MQRNGGMCHHSDTEREKRTLSWSRELSPEKGSGVGVPMLHSDMK